MAKKNKSDSKHIQNTKNYAQKIDSIYRSAVREASVIGLTVSNFNPNKPFSFADYPITHKRIDELLNELQTGISTVILNGIDAEWTLANNKNSELANIVFGDNVGKLSQEQYRRYYSNNHEAREAFIARKDNGLNLSDRVWRYSDQFKTEIEMGLDLGIRNGMSADEMSRDLRDYLQNPDKLFRRVRDAHGLLHLSKAAMGFHPGAGVYRSSYKNAMRLTRTETNIAYRTADFTRWQQLDFVVGIEIRLSNNHPCTDICDMLAGKYPKDFKFTGWHPQCMCHAIPILKTMEEMQADNDRIMNGEQVSSESTNSVRDVPEAWNGWIDNNRERAKGWGNMPYFVKDNPHYVKGFEVNSYTKAERKFTRAFKTNDAMKESLGTFLQSKYPELPNTEKAAIFHYTKGEGAAFRHLNNQLRKENLSEFNEAFSGLLSQGISKLETTKEIAYRSVRVNKTQLRGFADLANSTGSTTFKGFTSASLERSEAVGFGDRHAGRKNNERDVLLVIRGKSGHPIEDLSQFGGRFVGKTNQREVLFDKGLKVRFDKVEIENGLPVFYLTEI